MSSEGTGQITVPSSSTSMSSAPASAVDTDNDDRIHPLSRRIQRWDKKSACVHALSRLEEKIEIFNREEQEFDRKIAGLRAQTREKDQELRQLKQIIGIDDDDRNDDASAITSSSSSPSPAAAGPPSNPPPTIVSDYTNNDYRIHQLSPRFQQHPKELILQHPAANNLYRLTPLDEKQSSVDILVQHPRDPSFLDEGERPTVSSFTVEGLLHRNAMLEQKRLLQLHRAKAFEEKMRMAREQNAEFIEKMNQMSAQIAAKEKEIFDLTETIEALQDVPIEFFPREDVAGIAGDRFVRIPSVISSNSNYASAITSSSSSPSSLPPIGRGKK